MGDAESRCDEWFDRRCVCGDAEFFQCPPDELEMGGTDDRLMVPSHVVESPRGDEPLSNKNEVSPWGRTGVQGWMPRSIVASATRSIAWKYAPCRSDTWCACAFSQVSWRARCITLSRRVDLVFVPEEGLQVLHPLEVRDDHTPCVGDHVRHHGDPSLLEDRVGVRGHGPVCRLQDQFRLDAAGILRSDLVLERTGISTSTGNSSNSLKDPYPRTPAMAAGVADHVWRIEEIVALLDA
jgi:hypothetical protein